jgi:hypothetical protein
MSDQDFLGTPDQAANAAMNPPDSGSSDFSVVPPAAPSAQPTTSPTATPSYPDSPDENPANNPIVNTSDDPSAAAPAKHSLFRNILIGALSGIKDHLVGMGEGALVGGIPGAIVGAASPKMADNALKAQQSMRNSEVQQARYVAQNAQEQLAINQTHLMELQREYSLLPKTQQESFDRAHESELRNQYNTLTDSGNARAIQNFGHWEDPNAWSAFQVLHGKYMEYGTPSPFNYVPSVNPQGDLVMLKVHDPNQGLHEAQTIATNQTKPNGDPITITVPAGTPWATYQGIVLQSQLDDIKSQRKINESSATGATAKNEATAAKSNAQASNGGSSAGITPGMKMFKKDADNLAKTEGTYSMFQDVLNDINSGKNVTGAKSVVALFNAIGLSAEPLQGKGMRINQNTVAEHVNARGLGGTLYQKLLGLQNGDIITPQQIKDYASIAATARRDAYVNKINEVRDFGQDPSFLMPQGNGRALDLNTAQIFLAAANGDKESARKMAAAKGWRY